MSFSPEVFHKKLDALSETQDSIVSISQWVLFHHRHASQLCELWAEYCLANTDTPSKKKLSLLYLCNDVVQQARHKRKPEFSAGFAPFLPRVLYTIYGSVDNAFKPKVERLISVWSQRNVFTKAQIDAMLRSVQLATSGEEYSDAVEVAESSKSDSAVGVSVAPELAALNENYTKLNALLATASANMASVAQQSSTYLPDDPSSSPNLPSPKVYLSKLAVLEKLCKMTTSTLEDTRNTRQGVRDALAGLLQSVTDASNAEDEKLALLDEKLTQIASTKAELLEMVGEPEPEQSSPAFEPEQAVSRDASASDNLVPTYEDTSDDSDSDKTPLSYENAQEDIPPPPLRPSLPRKRSLSESSMSSGASKKSVAFSEQIEVKEFERDEQSNFIDIVGNSGQNSDDSDDGDGTNSGSDDATNGENGIEAFEAHHKDAVELLHEQKQETDEEGANGDQPEEDSAKNGLLRLLQQLN